jgi:hypothetical protein
MSDEQRPTDPKPPGPKPVSEWGAACGRGFVSDSRFGSGQVIKRTNRSAQRKRYRPGGGEGAVK